MPTLSLEFYIGIGMTFLVVLILSFYAMKQVKKADDLLLGKSGVGALSIVGVLLGTILGGASTIGTAQMAFSQGITGIWFTVGCASGLAFLGFLLGRLEKVHGIRTIPQLLCRRYGTKARPITGIISIFGIFFSIVASNLSMSDLISLIFGGTISSSYLILFFLIMIYTLFGGMLGAGWVGLFKVLMMYGLLIISGIIAFEGLLGEQNYISRLSNAMVYNLFPRGWTLSIGAYLSTIVGVVSTQTYLQAYFPAKSISVARRGYWLSALLILPVGVLSVAIGMFMRASHPELLASQAMPYFIIYYLPPMIGGMGSAVLVLGGMGTAAGLILGMTTIVLKDLLLTWNSVISEKCVLWLGRTSIFALGLLGILFSFWQHGSQILIWNYLSMGLRGAGVFLPLVAALLLPRRFDSYWVVVSMAASTLTVLGVQFLTNQGARSLWYGLGVSFIILAFAYWRRYQKKRRR